MAEPSFCHCGVADTAIPVSKCNNERFTEALQECQRVYLTSVLQSTKMGGVWPGLESRIEPVCSRWQLPRRGVTRTLARLRGARPIQWPAPQLSRSPDRASSKGCFHENDDSRTPHSGHRFPDL